MHHPQSGNIEYLVRLLYLGLKGGGVVTIDVCVDIQVTRTTQVTIIVAIGPTIDAWCSR